MKLERSVKIFQVIFVVALIIGFGLMTREVIKQEYQIMDERSEARSRYLGYEEEISTQRDYYEEELRQKNDEIQDLKDEISRLLKMSVTTKATTYKVSTSTVKVTTLEKSTLSNDSGFRSYMPYTAITNRASDQYKIVSKASSDSDGLMKINDKPLVAIGTGWGLRVGDSAVVTTTRGSFEVVIGDYKANSDTDYLNKVTLRNGCVVEFIVDYSTLSPEIRYAGTVSVLPQYDGLVLSIEKTGTVW